MSDFSVESGGTYLDGNGKVHGPLDPHPSQPELFFIATGATYYHDGRHTSGDLSPAHAGLNLVQRVHVSPALLVTCAREWHDARAAFLMLPAGSAETRPALDRLANAENALFTVVRGHGWIDHKLAVPFVVPPADQDASS
jgi:hypothetical protein